MMTFFKRYALFTFALVPLSILSFNKKNPDRDPTEDHSEEIVRHFAGLSMLISLVSLVTFGVIKGLKVSSVLLEKLTQKLERKMVEHEEII